MTDSTLISTSALADLEKDSDLVILDVRASLADHGLGLRQYHQGHIPGARFDDMETDVSGQVNGKNGRHPFPSSTRFCESMRRLGIKANDTIVIYDDGLCNFAARLWFTFRYFGCCNVQVLDGGISRWIAEKRMISQATPSWPNGDFCPGAPLEKIFTTKDIESNLILKSYLILDARTRNRFNGLEEPIDPIAGHIPGSKNRPSGDNLTVQGIFKSSTVLQQEFLSLLGNTPANRVINSCGSGVTACCNHLAMLHAGIPAAGVYIGSWSEWIADKCHPLCTAS